MNGHDLAIIAPLVAAVGVAVAVLIVDLALPGATMPRSGSRSAASRSWPRSRRAGQTPARRSAAPTGSTR